MQQISNQLDYKKDTFIHPTYRYNKILPQVGTQSKTILAAGGDDTIFEIPVNAFNLNRSFLQYVFAPAAAAAVGRYWAYKDVLSSIRQMQLYTRSGLYLCDINEVANYTKFVTKAETPLKEYLTYDTYANGGVATPIGFGRGLRVSNAAVAANQRPQDAGANSINYTEPEYIEYGSGANTTPCLQIMIPLGMIKNTIFSLDKNIYLGEIILLRIVWNPTSKMFFSTSSNDPTDTVVSMANNVSLTNLTLYLAVEKNPEIVNQLRSQIASSGFSVLIPYVYTYKYNLGPAGSQTVSLKFNRGHGRTLVKIFHSVFNNGESISGAGAAARATAYDNDNRSTRSKTQVFYTMLDNERLQEYNLTTANGDDYFLLKDKLKDTVYLNSDIFYYNWFWLEDFSGITKETTNEQNLETGLDLSVERKWDFYGVTMNTSNNVNANLGQYNHYTYAVTQKMLTVTSSGITVI